MVYLFFIVLRILLYFSLNHESNLTHSARKYFEKLAFKEKQKAQL